MERETIGSSSHNLMTTCHSEKANSNKWPKSREPWRRGATGFCKLLWQLLSASSVLFGMPVRDL